MKLTQTQIIKLNLSQLWQPWTCFINAYTPHGHIGVSCDRRLREMTDSRDRNYDPEVEQKIINGVVHYRLKPKEAKQEALFEIPKQLTYQ